VDNDGSQLGVIATSEALVLARRRGLDLVEVAATAQPPVCRIMDFGKYKYELSKKERESRRSQSTTKVKEIKFHANVDDNDYSTKLRHIRDFLGEGHRVKVSLMFRGRENAHQEIGFQLMRRVQKDCQDLSGSDRPPEQMGRFLFLMLMPRPGGPKPARAEDRPAEKAPADAPPRPAPPAQA
jgi:translation initiation factor IF-3